MNEAIDRYQSKAVLNDTQKFPPSIQKGIDNAMLPVYRNMNALLDQIGYAKKLQKNLSEKISFYQELSRLNAMLCNAAGSKLSEFKKSLDRLHTLCRNMETERAAFEKILAELDAAYLDMEKESQAMQSLRSLAQKGGLLPRLNLALKARINGQRSTFRWKDLQDLPALATFEENERKELHSCILSAAACTDLGQMNIRWRELQDKLNDLFARHHDRQNKLLIENRSWAQQFLQAIEITTSSSHQELVKTIENISASIQTIAQISSEIRIRKVETIPNRIISALGGLPATIGAVSGGALAAVALLPGMVAYPLLGVVGLVTGGALWYAGQGKLALINTAAGAAITAAAASTLPAAGPLLLVGAGAVGGYLEGRKLQTAIPAHISDQQIFPQVMDEFDKLYDFLLKPHVWKWAILDSLKCVNEAYQQ